MRKLTYKPKVYKKRCIACKEFFMVGVNGKKGYDHKCNKCQDKVKGR